MEETEMGERDEGEKSVSIENVLQLECQYLS